MIPLCGIIFFRLIVGLFAIIGKNDRRDKMLQKSLNTGFMILTGIILIFIGNIFIFDIETAILTTYQFYLLSVIVLTGTSVIYALITKWNKHKFKLFVQIMIFLIVGIVCYDNSKRLFMLIPSVLGVWLIIQGIVKGITCYVMIHDKLPRWKSQLAITLIYIVFGISAIFYPSRYTNLIVIACGIYFVIYGLSIIQRAVVQLLPENAVEAIYLSIPTMLGALLPPWLLKKILYKSEKAKIIDEFNVIKKDIKPDLEVMVHVAQSGPAQLGHCDLVYHGSLISYGCYDPHNRKLFGTFGDGVVIIAPKNEYLYNCLKNENKVIISFGLVLDKKRQEELEILLREAIQKLVPFECDQQLLDKGIQPLGICDDYLSRVTRNVKQAHYYKINEGKYHTFFVFYTNCVSYVAQFLNQLGFSFLDFSGIISPGSYYDFLNKQFKSGKGHVISRKIYTKYDAEQFVDK